MKHRFIVTLEPHVSASEALYRTHRHGAVTIDRAMELDAIHDAYQAQQARLSKPRLPVRRVPPPKIGLSICTVCQVRSTEGHTRTSHIRLVLAVMLLMGKRVFPKVPVLVFWKLLFTLLRMQRMQTAADRAFMAISISTGVSHFNPYGHELPIGPVLVFLFGEQIATNGTTQLEREGSSLSPENLPFELEFSTMNELPEIGISSHGVFVTNPQYDAGMTQKVDPAECWGISHAHAQAHR